MKVADAPARDASKLNYILLQVPAGTIDTESHAKADIRPLTLTEINPLAASTLIRIMT
jgi:hypothetical protein